jgi:inorganic pyrophosphatase/exopolyphosphatase
VHIDMVGAAATLIYEQWEAAGRLDQLSSASTQLLAAAILDNTLNFQAGVTTKRDRQAYAALAACARLDAAWAAQYFAACQQTIVADMSKALRNDTKLLHFKGLPHELCLSQLVVWDAQPVLAAGIEPVAAALAKLGGAYWLANVVSISEGTSYFVSNNADVQRWLHALLGVQIKGPVVPAGRLWLRKEIIKAAQDAEASVVS